MYKKLLRLGQTWQVSKQVPVLNCNIESWSTVKSEKLSSLAYPPILGALKKIWNLKNILFIDIEQVISQ